VSNRNCRVVRVSIGRQKRVIGFTRVEERNEEEQTYRMLSELVALQMLEPNRVKELGPQQLEAELERARTENADYLRQCEESGVLPNGVIAGSSPATANQVLTEASVPRVTRIAPKKVKMAACAALVPLGAP